LLYYDRSLWPTLTTALSPVEPLETGGVPVVLGALNYDILADSPTEIGTHQVRTFQAYGARHEVALVSPVPLDIEWLSEQCKTIVATEAAMFGGVPYDRYVFFVYAGSNLTGGLEHARCSVNMCDVRALTSPTKAKSLLALLCHEYFHVWNVKRIRPREYGPFDYTREVHSPMLWLAEGVTSYYDDLFAYRAGFYTAEEYLQILARDHFGKLLHVPGRRAMSVRESSYLAWVKLYAQSPDGQNRFPSYYLKGGVLALLLDLAILHATDGARRLDDVMRMLWETYQRRPYQGVDEEEVFEAIEEVSTRAVREQFMRWLDSTEEPDIARSLEPFGIEWIVRDAGAQSPLEPASRWLGMQLRSDGGRLVVTSVEEGSPAWQAGIAVDDEIIALADRRVVTPEEFELLSSRVQWPAAVTAACDGILYTATVEASSADEFELRAVALPTERQRTLRERWLERSLLPSLP
ncbi:MAG: M61 family peptidase, partial [Chlorobiota bacterium]